VEHMPMLGSNNVQKPVFSCIWSNEIDRYACQIYRKHYGEGELYEGDITKVDAGTIPDHDLLCAGFPCPSFSIAGKRKGFQDKRGQLFFEIIRIAKAKEPMYLLLENVKGLISHDKGKTLKKYLNTCKAWGIILIGKYTTRKSMVFRKTGKGYFLYADI